MAVRAEHHLAFLVRLLLLLGLGLGGEAADELAHEVGEADYGS